MREKLRKRTPSQSLRDSSPGGRDTGEGEPLRIASPLRRGGSALAESERLFAGDVLTGESCKNKEYDDLWNTTRSLRRLQRHYARK